jgi:peptidoglycan/LPS O-acetylase OafA/YrhL
MKRDNCFDFLRFLFAFNVVLGHLTVIALYPELTHYKGVFQTHLSVVGFFVISGFLIAQSYEHSSTIKDYFTKRAKRLLPAYLFVVIGCAIGLGAVSALPANEYYLSPDWWKYIGANICFLNFLHPSLPGVFDNPVINDNSVNPALWTLKIEVGFYLILPLLMIWIRKSKRPWGVLLFLYLFALLYKEGCSFAAELTNSPFPNFLARQLPGFMTYFAAGMGGYIYKDYFLQYKNYLILPALLIFIIENYFGMEILSPVAWGIIVLWAAYSLRILNNFGKYGDISYGIYIYHGPIIKTLLTVGCFSVLGVKAASFLYIALVILAGMASWHLLEKQILKRKK